MKPELFAQIALCRDLDELGLKKGDVATLVDYIPHPQGGEEGCILEIFNAIGDSIQIATVPVSMIMPLSANEVPAVRRRHAV
ncbi:MAG: DUF4926 domain-containing protein [Candidatus Hydrogenedentes bacterium]|nr:DUF4926 domain-containing protein [Candidatus Hydrogenedentota bacterium]